MSELPDLSLNVPRYLVSIHKNTVKQLSSLFGTTDRETRYALDCLFNENLIRKTPNLKNMKSVYFQYEETQEHKIIERLGVNCITEVFYHKPLFERNKTKAK
ncbi:MAG: hypothetical protein HeimC2_13890 [Candidatus Heimdallarchaeota archaeon LC_2]|nr:MAG: hypothetical protein HeimC2_13890 [Candidatus Heimdallarchaeota archaeon LC_2]